MTEVEWLSCTDSTWMFDFVCAKPNHRTFRLFACQCVRDALGINHVWGRRAVEVAELMADGEATDSIIAEARSAMESFSMEATNAWSYLASAATAILQPDAVSGARSALENMVGFALEAFNDFDEPKCATVIRDIFGNPFRPITINPNWLTPTVSNLAKAAYEHRAMPSGELDNPRLSVLADALEEAGCDNQYILGHLRSPGPHVRGYHVLDLLLGKE